MCLTIEDAGAGSGAARSKYIMKVYELRRETWVPAPLATVFEFFSDAANLEKLTPEFLGFHILTPQPIAMHPGAEIEYTLKIRGIRVKWKTIIETWDPPNGFSDTQAKGPYKLWHHTHSFRESDGGTMMEDVVRYALPFGPLGRLAHWAQVRRDVEKIFDYRAVRIREFFAKAAAGSKAR